MVPKGITDPRFLEVGYHVFVSDSALSNSRPIEIVFPPLRGKAIYQIQKLVCLVDVRLLQSNGDPIPTGDEVAVGKSPKLDPSILSF